MIKLLSHTEFEIDDTIQNNTKRFGNLNFRITNFINDKKQK